jgi:hypothetical protein
MITYFKTLSDTSKPYYRDVSEAIKRIKEGNSKTLCELIRSEEDKSKRNELKRYYVQQPAGTVSTQAAASAAPVAPPAPPAPSTAGVAVPPAPPAAPF